MTKKFEDTDDDDFDLEEEIVDEEFEEDYDNGFSKWIQIALACGGILFFVALVWYTYHSGVKSTAIEDVPMIEADAEPVKEAPKDPGGMQVLHKDKTVYESFSSSKKKVVESVLPAPEEPVVREIAEDSKTQTWVNDKLKNQDAAKRDQQEAVTLSASDEPDNTADAVTQESNSTEKEEPKLEVKKPEETPKKLKGPLPDDLQNSAPEVIKTAVAEKKPVVQKSGKEPSKPYIAKEITSVAATKAESKPARSAAIPKPEAVKTIMPTASGIKIQLGSYKSEAEAKGDWVKISKKNASILSGKISDVSRADLPKGVFYRLQVSGFTSREGASAACAALAFNKQACFIVK